MKLHYLFLLALFSHRATRCSSNVSVEGFMRLTVPTGPHAGRHEIPLPPAKCFGKLDLLRLYSIRYSMFHSGTSNTVENLSLEKRAEFFNLVVHFETMGGEIQAMRDKLRLGYDPQLEHDLNVRQHEYCKAMKDALFHGLQKIFKP